MDFTAVEFFYLHLKETKFRCDVKVRGKNLYKILLKLIKNNIKF